MEVPDFLKYMILSGNTSFQIQENLLQVTLQKTFNEVWESHIRHDFAIISYFRMFDIWHMVVLDEKVKIVIPLEEYIVCAYLFWE